jgi:dephospho-CoA kinase
MLVIGLTGGIGSGKSTVSKMFQDVGVPVICADDLARKVVEPGSPALEEIREVFGEEVIDGEGRLDRAAMARVVFADASLRKKLEAIIHPRVKEEKDKRVEQLERDGHRMVIVDVPLLLESGWRDSFDIIIVVYVPRETQEKRLIYRDSISMEEARSRLNAQMCIEEKRNLADRVIDNSGSVDETRKQVGQIFEDLKIMAANKKSARA